MAFTGYRQATFQRAAPAASRTRCVRVVAHKTSLPAVVAASAAAALLLCSPVVAAPDTSKVLPDDKVITDTSRTELQTPGSAQRDNTMQGAAAPEDRVAVYAAGKGQTNAPCPTGQIPCY